MYFLHPTGFSNISLIVVGSYLFKTNPKKKYSAFCQNEGLRETETLLDQRRQLPDSTTLLTEHLPSPGGPDDDLSSNGRHSHFYSGIAVFSQGASQEFVEFGIENTWGTERDKGKNGILQLKLQLQHTTATKSLRYPYCTSFL